MGTEIYCVTLFSLIQSAAVGTMTPPPPPSRKQLHCLKKPAVKMVEFMVKHPKTYGIWKGYTRVRAGMGWRCCRYVTVGSVASVFVDAVAAEAIIFGNGDGAESGRASCVGSIIKRATHTNTGANRSEGDVIYAHP